MIAKSGGFSSGRIKGMPITLREWKENGPEAGQKITNTNEVDRMIHSEKNRFRPNEAYFVEHHNNPGWWVYQGSFPYAMCTIIPNEDWSVIEMHHVVVFDEHERRKGHGKRMISNVRRFFPEATIWVDTWDHSRPFWQAMVDKKYIDFIANDYAWPCFDTNCLVCHPNRVNGVRRFETTGEEE
jgi:hypothetical protein